MSFRAGLDRVAKKSGRIRDAGWHRMTSSSKRKADGTGATTELRFALGEAGDEIEGVVSEAHDGALSITVRTPHSSRELPQERTLNAERVVCSLATAVKCSGDDGRFTTLAERRAQTFDATKLARG